MRPTAQIQRENSRFRTLMAAQLNATGEESPPALLLRDEAHRLTEHADEAQPSGGVAAP